VPAHVAVNRLFGFFLMKKPAAEIWPPRLTWSWNSIRCDYQRVAVVRICYGRN